MGRKMCRVDGIPNIARILGQVEEKLARKAGRRGITKAARRAVKIAKAKAPVETGTLKKSITHVTKTSKRTRDIYAVIGPRAGFERPVHTVGKRGKQTVRAMSKKQMAASSGKLTMRKPAKYAHLVEFGTKRHAPHSYLRVARDRMKVLLPNIIATEIKVEITKLRSK